MTRPKSIAELVAEARAARAAGMAQAEDADQSEWDRKVIDQAIDAFAGSGRKFSANSLRDLLPDVRPALIGSRFMAASVGGRIRRAGFVTSTKKNTHAKPVAVWVGTSPTGAGERPQLSDTGPTLFDDITVDLGEEAS